MADDFEAMVRKKNESSYLIEVCQNYYSNRHSVWGITALNREQNFALNLLMDPEIDFVSLSGSAGTGKTLLALAAGLTQTLDQGLYKEIIMTRVTIPIGEDIGFLPGTEEEKMTPWMGALMDNMEVLTGSDQQNSWEQAATSDLLRNRIKIRSLNFMRGRTFLNKYIIIDEAQKPDLQANENPGNTQRCWHQDRLSGKFTADRHALSDRNYFRVNIRSGSIQALGP